VNQEEKYTIYRKINLNLCTDQFKEKVTLRLLHKIFCKSIWKSKQKWNYYYYR